MTSPVLRVVAGVQEAPGMAGVHLQVFDGRVDYINRPLGEYRFR